MDAARQKPKIYPGRLLQRIRPVRRQSGDGNLDISPAAFAGIFFQKKFAFQYQLPSKKNGAGLPAPVISGKWSIKSPAHVEAKSPSIKARLLDEDKVRSPVQSQRDRNIREGIFCADLPGYTKLEIVG